MGTVLRSLFGATGRGPQGRFSGSFSKYPGRKGPENRPSGSLVKKRGCQSTPRFLIRCSQAGPADRINKIHFMGYTARFFLQETGAPEPPYYR